MHLVTMSKSGSLFGRVVGMSLGFLLFCGPVVSHGAAESLEIKTVISDGLGTDVPSAAQNAAQNALTNVVGSFIDASKMLEKRVEIQEGVRSATSRIDTNIKEYSQGSIQGFEVLEVSTQAGLTKVTAKVSVRIEDFKNYIKKLAEGEVAVAGESLFAQAATETKQSDNKVALLNENVISPIVNGEVAIFKIGAPRPLSQVKLAKNPNNPEIFLISGIIDAMAAQYGKENIFAISVTASLNPEFSANMKKTLASIAQKKTFRSTVGGLDMVGSCFDASKLLYGDANAACSGRAAAGDVVLLINNGSAEIDPNNNIPILNDLIPSEIYLIADAKEKLRQSSPLSKGLWEFDALPVQNLQIALLDSNNVVLQEETILAKDSPNPYGKQQPRAVSLSTDYTGEGIYSAVKLGFSNLPWLMLRGPGNYRGGIEPLRIFEQRAFDIFLAIKPEALAKAKMIRVNLVN